ncbi:ankyrin repeat RF_0381 isoform X2 [Octopus vulgaris]|uniref:Ankyrin repeat RF_0381 isoform X2 n=1 Tax=Octopus vulgaris TaxID=6645 RepID=A0AA36HHL8_OCTVU|nr:ankyrin repeat RF_0381 isoform X2 [Octopus vulgaris]
MSSLFDAASRRSASSAQNFPLLSEMGIAAFRVDPAVLIHVATHSGLPVINKPINEYGRTPLMFACRVGANRRIFEILIEAGAELGAKDYRGGTAIHYAVLWDRHQAVEILLSRGCDVNPRDVDGQTPLHCACSSGCFHTVELLLSHNGIDVNVVDKEGDTPLHVAVQQRKYKVVCAMLSKCCTSLNLNEDEMLSGVVIISQIVEPQQNLASSSNLLHLITLCSFTIFLGYMTTSIRTVIMVPMFQLTECPEEIAQRKDIHG